jgi:hypothetical protein
VLEMNKQDRKTIFTAVLVAIIVSAALLIANIAGAQEAIDPGCLPTQALIEATSQHPNYKSHVVVTDPAALARADVLYNAVPPESDIHHSLVIFFDGKNGVGILYYGSEKQVCDRLVVGEDKYQQVKRLILGQDS